MVQVFERVLVFGLGGMLAGTFGGGIVGLIPGTHGEGGLYGALEGGVKGGITGVLAGLLLTMLASVVLRVRLRAAEAVIPEKYGTGKSGQGVSRGGGGLIRGLWRTLDDGRWLPILLFFMMCVCMWFIRGIHHGGDTGRYLNGAENLLKDQPLVGKQAAYIGYIVFVAIIKFLGLGKVGIVAAQVAISALCVYALHDLGRRLGGEISGIIAASLYAINLDIGRFTFAILTDSLYTSGLIFSVYLTYRAMTSPKGWAFPASLVMLFTASVRPGGGLIVPIFGAFVSFGVLREWGFFWRLISFLIFMALTSFLFLKPIQISYKAEDPVGKLLSGQVIYGHKASNVSMPEVGEVSKGNFAGALEYCVRYPLACGNLFLRRVIVFFEHTRPFYSFRHNLAILLTYLPLYAAAVIAFAYRFRDAFTWLVLALIGFQTIFVGLTFADWDGRFLTYVFPLITLYSAVGVVYSSDKVFAILTARRVEFP